MPEAIQALATAQWPLAARLFVDLQAPEVDAATLQSLANNLQSSTGDNVVQATNGLVHGIDLLDLLPKLTVPTTVIHRVGDLVPYRAGRELAARIPSSCFVPLEGTSHLPFLGNSAAVLSAIARALGDDPIEERTEGSALRENLRSTEDGVSHRFLKAESAEVAVEITETHDAIFRRDGEYWTIAYGAHTLRQRDSRGLRYIAQLLRYPAGSFALTSLKYVARRVTH